MKTIHESLIELLEMLAYLHEIGLDVQIVCVPQELPDVPKEMTSSLANAYLPRIMDFYKNEDNQKEYEEWKKTQTNPKTA